MALLEPAEQEKRYAEKALTMLEGDSSVSRFDEILRAALHSTSDAEGNQPLD